MTPEILLLLIRLFSALLLLGFLGGISWLIYRDMQITAAALAEQGRQHGRLRVVANESGQPAVDTTFPLMPLTSIGRASSNTIVLSDGFASSEHAILMRRNGQWWLEDQGSRNGTLLNEVPIQGAVVVSAGDIIAVGGTQLKIEL